MPKHKTSQQTVHDAVMALTESPPRTKWDDSDARLKRLLERHKSVVVVAAILDVHAYALSHRLNRPRLKEWWTKTKSKWKKERHAAKVRRWRHKHAPRLLARQVLRVLDERPRPSTWTPTDVQLFLRAGALTREQAIQLAQARLDAHALWVVDQTLQLDTLKLRQAAGDIPNLDGYPIG